MDCKYSLGNSYCKLKICFLFTFPKIDSHIFRSSINSCQIQNYFLLVRKLLSIQINSKNLKFHISKREQIINPVTLSSLNLKIFQNTTYSTVFFSLRENVNYSESFGFLTLKLNCTLVPSNNILDLNVLVLVLFEKNSSIKYRLLSDLMPFTKSLSLLIIIVHPHISGPINKYNNTCSVNTMSHAKTYFFLFVHMLFYMEVLCQTNFLALLAIIFLLDSLYYLANDNFPIFTFYFYECSVLQSLTATKLFKTTVLTNKIIPNNNVLLLRHPSLLMKLLVVNTSFYHFHVSFLVLFETKTYIGHHTEIRTMNNWITFLLYCPSVEGKKVNYPRSTLISIVHITSEYYLFINVKLSHKNSNILIGKAYRFTVLLVASYSPKVYSTRYLNFRKHSWSYAYYIECTNCFIFWDIIEFVRSTYFDTQHICSSEPYNLPANYSIKLISNFTNIYTISCIKIIICSLNCHTNKNYTAPQINKSIQLVNHDYTCNPLKKFGKIVKFTQICSFTHKIICCSSRETALVFRASIITVFTQPHKKSKPINLQKASERNKAIAVYLIKNFRNSRFSAPVVDSLILLLSQFMFTAYYYCSIVVIGNISPVQQNVDKITNNVLKVNYSKIGVEDTKTQFIYAR